MRLLPHTNSEIPSYLIPSTLKYIIAKILGILCLPNPNNPVDREFSDNCELMIALTGKHQERMSKVRQHLFRQLTN